MADKIFLVHGSQLVPMERSKYALEDHLQELLARYPDLMPGEQIDPDAPLRWLLVSREIGIRDGEAAIDRWSLDHLFLDQQGVPTLVEAKRSTDPRIRREVVGQMIEYASNAQSFWSVQGIRDLVMTAIVEESESELLSRTLGVADVEEFWQKVKSNLQAGRLRLIFVADEIPRELKQMIEFLNTQMDPAEVYGIELPQFLGGELQTIVPRLVGNTTRAAERKGKRLKNKWDEESFFADLSANCAIERQKLVKGEFDWCSEKGLRIWWGEGTKYGSFVACMDEADQSYQLLRFTSHGDFSVMLDFIRSRPVFEGRNITREVVTQIIAKLNADIDLEARRPRMSVEVLSSAEKRQAFHNIVESLIEEIRRLHRSKAPADTESSL